MDDTLSRPALFVPASKYSSLPEGIDTALVDAVDTILKQGDVAVCKATRSGFTTSVIIAAHRQGLKILIVSPTKKMLSKTVRDTVKKIRGVYCNIPGNQSCKHVKKLIEKDQFLSEMPIPKDKCSKCDEYGICPVTAIERIDNFTVVTMTYSKLEAIIMSEEESKRIGNKLGDIDLVIFDEAHTISFPSLPQVDFDKHVALLDWEYHAITGVYNRFRRLMDQNRDHVDQIKFETEFHQDHYTGFQVEIPNSTSLQILHLQFEQLLEIAVTRKIWWPKDIADDNMRALRDIISIMGSPSATMSYIKSGDIEKMVVTNGQGNIQWAISYFLSFFVPEAKVCFVSGTLIECRPGFFSGLAMREITNVIFPDFRNTNAKMHIHPSRWKFSALDGNNGIERAIKEIQVRNEELGHQPISILAMNKRFSEQLKKGLGDYANLKVDYYRSEDTIGISQPERISIAVGLAHLPRHTCDPLAQGADDHERYLDSQQLRLNEVHAATWQAWSRVKGPDGEVESHIYCVGIRADEISDVVTWGTNRTIKASSDSDGKRIWTVEVDQELARPIVHAEERTSKGLNRHGIHEYIDRIQPVKSLIEYEMNSQKSTHFPYINSNYNRENVDILGNSHILYLFNDPSDHDQTEFTSFALSMLFTGRLDCHVCQSKNPGKVGEYSFRKQETITDIPSLIEKHLEGSEVIGFYPFDAQDLCYYCAIDLDDYNGPQSDNAMKLSNFLLDHNLPVIVEKLTSHDSYHIWIPIIPTKTHTVYKFVRQVLHDAGLKGDAYPKQKSISTCHTGSCGDFLALPLGINSDKIGISEFIDPRTLEPVGLVLVDKVVRLRDVAEPRTVMDKPPPEDDANQE